MTRREQAPLYGPLVLAGITLGERALPAASTLVPVPASAREQLTALKVSPPRAEGGSSEPPGCLVTRWQVITHPSTVA